MDQCTTEYFKSRLLEMKKELQDLNEGINEGGLKESFVNSISELSTYDNHPGDIASETFERSKDLALKDNTKIRIQKVDDAIERINEGNYGKCDICGKEIDIDRLQAMPETTQCSACRQQEEQTLDRHLRPIEEDVIRPLYGDNKADNEFDGEDTWQKLANWNEHAEESEAGSYYGGDTNLDENNSVDFMDSIPYKKGKDGVLYEDIYGKADESAPKWFVGKKKKDEDLLD